MCALKNRGQRGKAVRVSPQITKIRRRQLAENFVNTEQGVFMEVKRKGSLLSFRPDIKVLDATLRDGGL